MRFHRSFVTVAKPLPFEEEIDFSSLDAQKSYPLLGLKEVYAKGEFFKEEDGMLYASFHVRALATLSDSRTLEPFEEKFDYEDEFALLERMDEEAEGYLFAEKEIELKDVVYCSLHSHIPLCPHKAGAKLPLSGEGYTVYEDDEQREEEPSSPFDVLKDYAAD